MFIKTLALLSVVAAPFAAGSCLTSSDICIDDFVPAPDFDFLAKDPQVQLLMDIYDCDDSSEGDGVDKWVLLAPGAPLNDLQGERAGKLAWSMLSNKLAEEGYKVGVLEKAVSFGFPPIELTFVLPSDFNRAIEYIGFPDTVYIGGQSFGGSQVLLLLAGQMPPPPLAVPGTTLGPPDASIKGAFVFGAAVFEPLHCDDFLNFAEPAPANEPECSELVDDMLTNPYNIPVLFMYGEGERLAANPQFNIDSFSGGFYSYFVQSPAKAFVVLKGLDHNSLLDTSISTLSNVFESALDREDQVSIAFDAIAAFLEILSDPADSSDSDSIATYCSEIEVDFSECDAEV